MVLLQCRVREGGWSAFRACRLDDAPCVKTPWGTDCVVADYDDKGERHVPTEDGLVVETLLPGALPSGASEAIVAVLHSIGFPGQFNGRRDQFVAAMLQGRSVRLQPFDGPAVLRFAPHTLVVRKTLLGANVVFVEPTASMVGRRLANALSWHTGESHFSYVLADRY